MIIYLACFPCIPWCRKVLWLHWEKTVIKSVICTQIIFAVCNIISIFRVFKYYLIIRQPLRSLLNLSTTLITISRSLSSNLLLMASLNSKGITPSGQFGKSFPTLASKICETVRFISSNSFISAPSGSLSTKNSKWKWVNLWKYKKC